MATLREFVNDELPLDHDKQALTKGEIITDAVLIYRIVRMDDEGIMTERADYIASKTCGTLLAKGMLNDVLEQWSMDYADQYFKDRGDDTDD